MPYTPDAIDLTIIASLQQNARLANTELAKKCGMAPSAVLERVKKLEQKGVIKDYSARIDPAALNLKLLAFISIKSSAGPGDASTARQIAKIPEVLEVHHIAGEDCYLVKIRTEDPQSLIQLMREKFAKIPNIISTKTTIVLETLKEDNYLPVPKS
ncbi:MAG TPA: Lrp/AsnC family transcriptional regulator [Chitinophagaceae bacterium]|nr:Lrp/AsnC family transcriptional regulator [Chitinophagaceae bacterium]